MPMQISSGFMVGAMQRKGHRDAGRYDNGGPSRIVLHTSEGGRHSGSADALDNVLRQKRIAYHLGVNMALRTVDQYLWFGVAASALRSGGTNLATNRAGAACIQVCLMGRAAEVEQWPEEEWDWLTLEVLAPICQTYGVRPDFPKFLGQGDGLLASVGAKQRFSPAVWRAFGGICGHQHVPANDHWDPGRIPTARIASVLSQTPEPEGGQIVPAQYDPPLDLAPIVAWCPGHDGRGVIQLGSDGGIYLFGVDPDYRQGNVLSPAGQSYFDGMVPARVIPTGPGRWQVITTTGHTYNYPHS